MGKIAEFLKTVQPRNEATNAKEIQSVLTALNSSGSFGGKYPIGNKELIAKVKSLESSGYIEYDDKADRWKKGSKKVSGKEVGEDGGDSMSNNGAIPTGDSKTSGFIKELINTSWSGSNDEQMKAVELLKGLATSDEPEANDFMKKLDDFTSQMKAEEDFVVGEDYESEVKKLRAEKEKLLKLQHATREKVGGGITHPEVAKVYVKICDVDIALYKLHIKETEEKLAASKKRRDKSAIKSQQGDLEWLHKQIKKEEDSKKEHQADIAKGEKQEALIQELVQESALRSDLKYRVKADGEGKFDLQFQSRTGSWIHVKTFSNKEDAHQYLKDNKEKKA